jgi:hypothetical protein
MFSSNQVNVMSEQIHIKMPTFSGGGAMTDEQWDQLKPYVERLRAAQNAARNYDLATMRIGGLSSDREQVFIESRIAWFKRQVDDARLELTGKRIEVLGS